MSKTILILISLMASLFATAQTVEHTYHFGQPMVQQFGEYQTLSFENSVSNGTVVSAALFCISWSSLYWLYISCSKSFCEARHVVVGLPYKQNVTNYKDTNFFLTLSKFILKSAAIDAHSRTYLRRHDMAAITSPKISLQFLQRIVLVLNSNNGHFPVRRLNVDALRPEDGSQIINGVVALVIRVTYILHI